MTVSGFCRLIGADSQVRDKMTASHVTLRRRRRQCTDFVAKFAVWATPTAPRSLTCSTALADRWGEVNMNVCRGDSVLTWALPGADAVALIWTARLQFWLQWYVERGGLRRAVSLHWSFQAAGRMPYCQQMPAGDVILPAQCCRVRLVTVLNYSV